MSSPIEVSLLLGSTTAAAPRRLTIRNDPRSIVPSRREFHKRETAFRLTRARLTFSVTCFPPARASLGPFSRKKSFLPSRNVIPIPDHCTIRAGNSIVRNVRRDITWQKVRRRKRYGALNYMGVKISFSYYFFTDIYADKMFKYSLSLSLFRNLLIYILSDSLFFSLSLSHLSRRSSVYLNKRSLECDFCIEFCTKIPGAP